MSDSSLPVGASMPDPRLLTRSTDQPGIGGRFRTHNDEFLVEEIDLFEPCGEGEHLFLRIQKDGISHRDLIGQLVRAFGVKESDIGYAGMKDRRAITQQTVSIKTDRTSLPDFDGSGIQIFWADRHRHKLRRGQLVGNRFSIRIREVNPLDSPRAWNILQHLERHGLPNGYMSQRFGYRLNNQRLGVAWLATAWKDLLDEWLGSRGSPFPDSERPAREDYDAGRYQQAIESSGREWWAERAALRALAAGASPARACSEIPPVIRQLWLDASQAAIFNRVLARRLSAGTWGRLDPDDLAWDHATGRWFRATEDGWPEDLPTRLERLEVSPTGPLHGRRMPDPGPSVRGIEQDAAEEAGVSTDQLVRLGGPRRGGRRPLRVAVRNTGIDSGIDERGGFIRLTFDLPRGAYATGVLSEIMGPEAVEERGWLPT